MSFFRKNFFALASLGLTTWWWLTPAEGGVSLAFLPLLIGGLAGLAGGIGGALINSGSQADANQANMDIAKMNNSANLNAMLVQQEYSTKMSNTAYQRSTADMRAAGINPMMAVQQGGASTPSASAIAAQNTRVESEQRGEALRAAAQSAMEVMRLDRELKQTDSQIELNKAAQATEKTKQDLNMNTAAEVSNRTAKTLYETYQKKAELPAVEAEAELRRQRAGIDQKFLKYDAGAKRLEQGVGIVGKALDAAKPRLNVNIPKKSDGRPTGLFKKKDGSYGYKYE